MNFGDKIKFLREERKISRKELSVALNITYSSLSKYETNVRFPDSDTLKVIAEFFDVSIDYLLGRSDIRNPSQEDSMPEIPEQFTDPDLAREYVSKHKIFGAHGFRPHLMSDEKILEFANALLEQMEILSYKYKK
jgi:transcriptional regulator with XRE-family HTH domain